MNQECQLDINVSELWVVHLTYQYLEQELLSQVIIINLKSDNTAMVSYTINQGGMVLQTHNAEACTLYCWAIRQNVHMRAIHQPGVNNQLANYLSRNRSNPLSWASARKWFRSCSSSGACPSHLPESSPPSVVLSDWHGNWETSPAGQRTFRGGFQDSHHFHSRLILRNLQRQLHGIMLPTGVARR